MGILEWDISGFLWRLGFLGGAIVGLLDSCVS